MNQSKTNNQEQEKEVEITNLDFGDTFDITATIEADRMVISETRDTGRAKSKENTTDNEIAH